MNQLKILPLATLLVLVPASGQDAATQKLQHTFETAVAALNQGNIDGFLANIHEGALSFYSCGPTSGKEGKEACQLDWERFFGKTAAAKFEPKDMQYRVMGNTGVAWGNYDVVVKAKDGREMRHQGRYTMTYTLELGEWRLVMQHNTPAADGPGGPRERSPQGGQAGS